MNPEEKFGKMLEMVFDNTEKLKENINELSLVVDKINGTIGVLYSDSSNNKEWQNSTDSKIERINNDIYYIKNKIIKFDDGNNKNENTNDNSGSITGSIKRA